MARHRNVRSLNADQEYEDFFICESDDSQDCQNEDTLPLSAQKMSLSDFIIPLSCTKPLKESETPESLKKYEKYDITINNNSPNCEYENSYAEPIVAQQVMPPFLVKKKLIFPMTSDTPVASPVFHDSRFKKAEAFYKTRNSNYKPTLNLVVVGHVDAGKSTIMGHMLVKLGYIGNEIIAKYKRQSDHLGKSSFAYAWIFDETNEERKRGITIDVAQRQFDTLHNIIIILDTPGHNDFISKMISGSSESDAALLVIDASPGKFESGFLADGQTKEHIFLLKSLGICQLIIAINKMDTVQWNQERFQEIVSKISMFLKKVGFKNIPFIPCSGYLGTNLVDPVYTSTTSCWYDGLTLFDSISNLQAPVQTLQNQFRLSTSDVFKVTGKGCSVSGRIQSGYVKIHDRVIIMPEKSSGTVSNIVVNELPVVYGFVGDIVELQLNGVGNSVLNVGSVICNVENPINVSSKLKARLVVFDTKLPITNGFPVVFQQQSFCEQAVIHKLTSLLCRNSGQIIKKRPRFLSKNSWADVEIHIANPMCFELYKDVRELGRFLLRYENVSIAAGMVMEILPL